MVVVEEEVLVRVVGVDQSLWFDRRRSVDAVLFVVGEVTAA